MSTIATRINSLSTKALHKFNCATGKEKETLHFEAGKPTIYRQNLSNGKIEKIQDGTEAKSYSTYEKATIPAIVESPRIARTIRVRITKGLKITIWLELALLVIRHFAPEVAEQIPAVYDFLDAVALPIINWLYAVAMKLVRFALEEEFVKTILDWLKNLAM